jgi:hypothetical protein
MDLFPNSRDFDNIQLHGFMEYKKMQLFIKPKELQKMHNHLEKADVIRIKVSGY